jgi:hypothetical protein
VKAWARIVTVVPSVASCGGFFFHASLLFNWFTFFFLPAPGASADQIAAVEAALGKPFPADLKESLALHDLTKSIPELARFGYSDTLSVASQNSV